MGIKTQIEWCDSTINPIMGCTGCALRKNHCYAARLCKRYAGRKGWPASFDQPEHFPGRLEKAVRWGDLTGKPRPDKPWLNGLPRHIFINNLSDGFCPDVDAYGWLLPHLDVMEDTPHIWLLLTKWPNRIREFFVSIGGAPGNFYLGTSIENQAAADERIPLLLQTPAAVHYVSVEPMLGPVDLWIWRQGILGWNDLDWIIVGGESGPGARPMHPQWARGLRDQCQAAGVPYFFKAWGEWVHLSQLSSETRRYYCLGEADDQGLLRPDLSTLLFPDGKIIKHVGKKAAGRLLEGREWNEMPKTGENNNG